MRSTSEGLVCLFVWLNHFPALKGRRSIPHPNCTNVHSRQFTGNNTRSSASVVSDCVSRGRDDVLKVDKSKGSSLHITMFLGSARRTISRRMEADEGKRGVSVGKNIA